MSVEAISWALNHAPVDESSAAFVLVGLANHAGPDGRGAFPAVPRLVAYTRLGERTVREYLDVLEDAGVITPGDPAVVAAWIKRGDRRPQGWDLNMTLTRENPEHMARFHAAMDKLKAGRKNRRARAEAKKNGDSSTSGNDNGVQPSHPEDSTGDGVRRSHPDSERGATVAGNGVRRSQAPGATVAPEPSFEPSTEPSPTELPAVGGLQVVEEPGEAVVPTGTENPASNETPHRPDTSTAESATASPGADRPPVSPALAVCRSLPQVVQERISQSASGKVLTVAQRELANRSVQELVDRIARRWEGWQRMNPDGRISDGVAVAITLIQRRHCPDVHCEDGHSIDTGQACAACADRPRRTPAAGDSPGASATDGGGSRGGTTRPPLPRRPDDGTVAEVLARVSYGEDPEPRRVPAPRVTITGGPSEEAEALLSKIRRPAASGRLKDAQAARDAVDCPTCGAAAADPPTRKQGENCRDDQRQPLPLQRQHSARGQAWREARFSAAQADALEAAAAALASPFAEDGEQELAEAVTA
ncbi:helix-turn-helix domain-containing protein [Nonomuraea sp. NPDC051941]|uniref:helix-turn-helix domain-containing protein n=1 Tax=Nonomuraea sp. NPDC051941 TaxID=3364373 RepID=UPI0037CC248C